MSQSADTGADRSQWQCAEPSWALFQDNEAIWRAVFEQCDAAKHSIDLEQYIFGTRGVGRQLLDLLARKAREGVAVRLLADGLGSRGLPRSDGGRALTRSGGGIAMFNGVSEILCRPVARAHRMHRKTLICDGSHVMVGGSCYEDRMSNWRDTMILVGGPLPPAIASAFNGAWRHATHQAAEALPALDEGASPGRGWSFAVSGPSAGSQRGLSEMLPEKIARAERSVSLTTPYLIPDGRLWRAMTAAAERGVKVQILMPARSDHRVLDVVGRRFAHALQRRGVEMRGYMRGMLHAKVALVDDDWSSISSFNLDLFSAKLNLESGVFSTSPALYQALTAQMEADLASSERL